MFRHFEFSLPILYLLCSDLDGGELIYTRHIGFYSLPFLYLLCNVLDGGELTYTLQHWI